MTDFDFNSFKKLILNRDYNSEVLQNNEIKIDKDVALSLSNVFMLLSIVFRYPTEEVYNELFSNFNKFEMFFEEYIGQMPSLPYREDLEPEYVSLFIARKGGIPAPLYSSVYTNEERLVLRDSTVKLKNMMLECGFKISDDLKEVEDNLYIMLEFLSSLIGQLIDNEYCKKEIVDRLSILFEVSDEYLGKMLPEFTSKVIEYAGMDFYKEMAKLLSEFVSDLDGLYLEMVKIG